MPLAEQIIRGVLGAFLGTVGFAMLVHTPKRAWFVSGLIASLSYMIYWLMTYLGLPDPMAIFIGSLFGSLAGLLSARLMKIIGTVRAWPGPLPDDGRPGPGPDRRRRQDRYPGNDHGCDDRAGPWRRRIRGPRPLVPFPEYRTPRQSVLTGSQKHQPRRRECPRGFLQQLPG